MGLACCADLLSVALVGIAVTSGIALGHSRYAWVGFPGVCFLSLVLVLMYTLCFLLSPVGSEARRLYLLGIFYHAVTLLVLFSCVVPLLYAILAWVVRAGLYFYLAAKRCPPPEENCVHCQTMLPEPEK